jgi:hypothetical protein
MNTYHSKDMTARRKRELMKQVDMTVTSGDLHFMTDFINDSGFYIEHLESLIGEDLMDFWQAREHALRLLTDWMMQAMTEPMQFSRAA